jgi:hypothetical protein
VNRLLNLESMLKNNKGIGVCCDPLELEETKIAPAHTKSLVAAFRAATEQSQKSQKSLSGWG